MNSQSLQIKLVFALPTEKISPEMKEAMMDTLLDINDMFESMVKERRKFSDQKIKEVSNGGVYTGRQALVNGLIDSLGDEGTAIKWLGDVKKIDSNLAIRDVELNYQEVGIERFFLSISFFNAYFDVLKSIFSGAVVAM